MSIVLFEDSTVPAFLPLAFTRPIGELRMGLCTNAERWTEWMNDTVTHSSRPHLQVLYPLAEEVDAGYLINARLLPSESFIKAIRQLEPGIALKKGNDILAIRFDESVSRKKVSPSSQEEYKGEVTLLKHLTDLFSLNDEVLRSDYERVTKNRKSIPLHDSNRLVGSPDQLFIEEGAHLSCAIINTTSGPVYIGRGAEIMEGAMIRGPFSLGDHAQVKMGARVYGATSIGPECRIGGEVSNSIFQGYSNKGHDGFIGNSVIGEWCNLGADTNCSNLKNNYSSVRTWNFEMRMMTSTGLTFCGLLMGDHAKSGINTMFNTGTVAGVCANIFGAGFPAKHIPSFSWGGQAGLEEYDITRALESMEKVMSRRKVLLTATYKQMLTEVFRITAPHRASATQSQE